MRKLLCYFAAATVAAVFFASCSAAVSIDKWEPGLDGQAHISGTIEISPPAKKLFSDLWHLDPEATLDQLASSMMDKDRFASCGCRANVCPVEGQPGLCRFELSILDKAALASALNPAGSDPLLSISLSKESFVLSPENFRNLSPLLPLLADQSVAYYLGEYNIGMSKSEYLDMMAEIVSPAFSSALDSSKVSIVRPFAGAEKDQTIPLMSLILLSPPVEIPLCP